MWNKLRGALLLVGLFLAFPQMAWTQPLPGFQASTVFNEQVRWDRLKNGVRVLVNAPARLQGKQRLLVVFATPNGNTLEQTLGCLASKERDWRFDIQHVAAQFRRLREIAPERDVILAVVQAPKLSWPAFRQDHKDADQQIRQLVRTLQQEVAAESVALTGHSGGGSFLFGYVNALDSLPADLERIVFLDANYSYSDDLRHGDKLLEWLKGGATRHLIVVAYDDREITLNGKKVVGPMGGTYRASQRMLTRFRQEFLLTESDSGAFRQATGLGGQLQVFVHPNPDNKILHTALVGEMNGLLQGMTLGTAAHGKWGEFGGPRAYSQWVQAEPFVDPLTNRSRIDTSVPPAQLALPDRPATALSGSQFIAQIKDLSRQAREAAVLREILSGNVPEKLRTLVPIHVEATGNDGVKHVGVYFVMPDYLAVGNDADSVRLPMTPQSAVAIAEAAHGTLITTKISEDLFAAATVKLKPHPLTKDRDVTTTFLEHHQRIEEQLQAWQAAQVQAGKTVPDVRSSLLVGIKKDVVWSNRLKEKPHKVAIYGWHQLDGQPIQPLYVGHVDWYVDYSHGVRLMADAMLVEGMSVPVADVLKDPERHRLVSDEGPMNIADLRPTLEREPVK